MESNLVIVGTFGRVRINGKTGKETYRDALGVMFDGNRAEKTDLSDHAIDTLWKNGNLGPIARLIGRVLGLNGSALGANPKREEVVAMLRLSPQATANGAAFKGNKARAAAICVRLIAQYEAHVTKVEAEKAAALEEKTVNAE